METLEYLISTKIETYLSTNIIDYIPETLKIHKWVDDKNILHYSITFTSAMNPLILSFKNKNINQPSANSIRGSITEIVKSVVDQNLALSVKVHRTL